MPASVAVQVVEAPEVLTVIHKLKGCQTFLNSLYHCEYEKFFPAFLEVIEQCNLDLLLHPHVRYYTREARVVVYSQFLESYKSVTIAAMAASFGVTPAFMDAEVRLIISASFFKITSNVCLDALIQKILF